MTGVQSRPARNGVDIPTLLRIGFVIDGDASPEELAALAEQSRRRSAVYDVLTNGTDVAIDVAVSAREDKR